MDKNYKKLSDNYVKALRAYGFAVKFNDQRSARKWAREIDRLSKKERR